MKVIDSTFSSFVAKAVVKKSLTVTALSVAFTELSAETANDESAVSVPSNIQKAIIADKNFLINFISIFSFFSSYRYDNSTTIPEIKLTIFMRSVEKRIMQNIITAIATIVPIQVIKFFPRE